VSESEEDEEARLRAEAVLAEAEAERLRILADERRRDLEVARREHATLDEESDR
jgi:hypothetical protein